MKTDRSDAEEHWRHPEALFFRVQEQAGEGVPPGPPLRGAAKASILLCFRRVSAMPQRLGGPLLTLF
jgi:hypothetical protein